MLKLFDAVQEILHGIEHYHDSYTLKHENNVGKLMKVLASSMGYDKIFCSHLEQVGSIHDIGKLALPAQLLEKPSSLNAFEREIIELHPLIGKKMLEKIDHPLAQLAAEINVSHHENYDGTGYPFKLQGESIPIESKICSICDVYDAMRTHRPYREGIAGHQSVVREMLSKKSGGMFHKFDPNILEVFSGIHEKFDEIFCSGVDGG